MDHVGILLKCRFRTSRPGQNPSSAFPMRLLRDANATGPGSSLCVEKECHMTSSDSWAPTQHSFTICLIQASPSPGHKQSNKRQKTCVGGDGSLAQERLSPRPCLLSTMAGREMGSRRSRGRWDRDVPHAHLQNWKNSDLCSFHFWPPQMPKAFLDVKNTHKM